jgi:hypothetical protein
MTSLQTAQTCQRIKPLRLAVCNVSYVSPYLFGGIVRTAAQHVKSNQGASEFRGERTTIVLKSAPVSL